MTLRRMIIDYLTKSNKGVIEYSRLSDIELFDYFVRYVKDKSFNEGYDQCCRDDPDIDNIVYLVQDMSYEK